MELVVRGGIVEWRGPAPFYYLPVPDAEAAEIAAVAALATYGWGVVPVHGRLGSTTFTTSLFPKDGGYLVPLKAAVRRAEGVDLGDEVVVHLSIDGT
jgi:hypothetical protein